MCGICGIYQTEPLDSMKERMLSMRDKLIHRGPDAEGAYVNECLAMGVRRLRIVDVEGSDQPLYNEDKSIVLVYNGMIYNFRELRNELIQKGHSFATLGDGEVIVHLYEEYGTECFSRLHGMFGIALYDVKSKRLVLVRDQLGIKPLYYGKGDHAFCFSSEVRSLLAADIIRRQLNHASIELFSAYNYIPGEETLYRNVHELKPGHMLLYEEGRTTFSRYWACANAVNEQKRNDDDVDTIVARIDSLVQESVERHMISDVEVGCFLSGGLDSSALVHYMEQHPRGRLKTFTIGYGDDNYDERAYAQEVVKKYNTTHIEMVCAEQHVIDFLEQLPQLGDAPVADQAIVSTYLVSKLAREHVKVCLSGEGGDELFAGYPTYAADAIYPFFNRMPHCVNEFAKSCAGIVPTSEKKLGFDYKMRRFFEGVSLHDRDKAHAYWRAIFSPEERRRLFKHESSRADATSIFDIYYDLVSDEIAGLEKYTHADLTTWLPMNNLMRADIFSMCNSIEVRVPLLYLPLVEYVMNVPLSTRFKRGVKKYLLKKMLHGTFDKKFIYRKKEGWHMPLAPWLKRGLYDYVRDSINSKHQLFDEVYDRNFCLTLLDEHKRGRQNNAFKIWSIVVLLKHLSVD